LKNSDLNIDESKGGDPAEGRERFGEATGDGTSGEIFIAEAAPKFPPLGLPLSLLTFTYSWLRAAAAGNVPRQGIVQAAIGRRSRTLLVVR